MSCEASLARAISGDRRGYRKVPPELLHNVHTATLGCSGSIQRGDKESPSKWLLRWLRPLAFQLVRAASRQHPSVFAALEARAPEGSNSVIRDANVIAARGVVRQRGSGRGGRPNNATGKRRQANRSGMG